MAIYIYVDICVMAHKAACSVRCILDIYEDMAQIQLTLNVLAHNFLRLKICSAVLFHSLSQVVLRRLSLALVLSQFHPTFSMHDFTRMIDTATRSVVLAKL